MDSHHDAGGSVLGTPVYERSSQNHDGFDERNAYETASPELSVRFFTERCGPATRPRSIGSGYGRRIDRGIVSPICRREATLVVLPVDARRSATALVSAEPADVAEAHARDSRGMIEAVSNGIAQ